MARSTPSGIRCTAVPAAAATWRNSRIANRDVTTTRSNCADQDPVQHADRRRDAALPPGAQREHRVQPLVARTGWWRPRCAAPSGPPAAASTCRRSPARSARTARARRSPATARRSAGSRRRPAARAPGPGRRARSRSRASRGPGHDQDPLGPGLDVAAAESLDRGLHPAGGRPDEVRELGDPGASCGRRVVAGADERPVVLVDELLRRRAPRSGGTRRRARSRPPGRAAAGRPAKVATASVSDAGSCGSKSSPVSPGSTRSSGPPAAAATTGTPLAWASCTVWQKVSEAPGCTKTSSDAKAAASSAPPSMPVNGRVRQPLLEPGALGSVADHDQADPGDVGEVDQPAYLLLGRQPADVPDDDVARRRTSAACSARSRRPGPNRSSETPRRHRCRLGTPRASSWAYDVVDGTSVRVQRAVQPADPPVDDQVGAHAVVAGEPGDVGLVDGDGRDPPAPGGPEADGPEHDRRRQVDDVGPEVRDRPLDARCPACRAGTTCSPGRPSERTRTTGTPSWCDGPGPGAITSGS